MQLSSATVELFAYPNVEIFGVWRSLEAKGVLDNRGWTVLSCLVVSS